MKVQGPGPVQGPAKGGKKDKKGGSAASSFDELIAGETPQAAATKATHSIAKVDSLLALQEAKRESTLAIECVALVAAAWGVSPAISSSKLLAADPPFLSFLPPLAGP